MDCTTYHACLGVQRGSSLSHIGSLYRNIWTTLRLCCSTWSLRTVCTWTELCWGVCVNTLIVTLFCFASCHQRDWRIIIKIINNYYYYRVYNYNITIVVAAKLQQNYNIFFSSSPVEEVPPSLPLRRPTACILSCGETDLQQRVDTLRLLASRVGSSISSFSSVVPSFCAS